MPDFRSRDLERKFRSVANLRWCVSDLRSGASKQIRGMEDLRLAMSVFGVVGFATIIEKLAAAGAQHRCVRQEHSGAMIAAVDVLRSEQRPLFGLRIPQLCGPGLGVDSAREVIAAFRQ